MRELSGASALDLGKRFESSDYAEALDFAFDYLQEHDPLRTGVVGGLAIFRVEPGPRTPVWTYTHAPAEERQEDLVALWGFDAFKWRGPALDVRPRR